MIQIDIPAAPPSVNSAYRNFRGRTVLSKEARNFHAITAEAVGGATIPANWKYVGLRVIITPPRRRCDIDNRVKVLLDSLTRAGFWQDDEQVATLAVEFRAPIKGNKAGFTSIVVIEEKEKYK